jgi:hypothetical protein
MAYGAMHRNHSRYPLWTIKSNSIQPNSIIGETNDCHTRAILALLTDFLAQQQTEILESRVAHISVSAIG